MLLKAQTTSRMGNSFSSPSAFKHYQRLGVGQTEAKKETETEGREAKREAEKQTDTQRDREKGGVGVGGCWPCVVTKLSPS